MKQKHREFAQVISDSPSFIKSSPVGKDLLEGQSQEQIAKSIADLIRSKQNEHRLIGLEGAWGSGKSNLVQILESKLSGTHHFFVYDAWGHQEDLQRRSFLEELTENLCEYDVIKSAVWNKKLKDLLSRKRETITKTVPRLSYGLVITVLIAVFTPIAQTISETASGSALKIFITSVPVLLGVLAYCIASCKAGRLLSISDIYAVYRDQELSSETHVTISEKEPSVREFQKWMSKLSNALTKEDKKNLVVVFDNMDRLPPDKVRELWSSIHTFFAEDSYEGIWIIVPFDRKHVTAAFENKEEISEEFLNKSFSVIYRVAPPVLTDWRKFFDLKFKEAFGESENEELHYIRKAFDCLQREITPRNIIVFINEIVALRRIVGREMLLRYIAVFVLAKKRILSAPLSEIVGGEYLEGAAAIFAEDEDLSNNIAALVYHVPPESASQVMLSREIQSTLNDMDVSRLAKLVGHSHFMDVLEQVVVRDFLDIGNAAVTLAELEDQDSSVFPEDQMIEIWNDLCAKETNFSPLKQEFTRAHELFLGRCSNARCEGLVRHLVKEFIGADDFRGDMYYLALSSLYDCVQENGLEIDVLAMTPEVKKPPDIFVDYVTVAQDNYKKFKLKCDAGELQNFVTERIPDDLTGLSTLSEVSDDYDFTSIVERLENEVTADSLTAKNVGPFYEFYKALSEEKPIKTIEPALLTDLLHQVEEGSEAQFDLLAMRVAVGPEFPSVGGIADSILNDTDEDVVDSIAGRIEYYRAYGSLLMQFLSWQQPILKFVLRQITINPPHDDSRLGIVKTLENYSDLQSALEITPEEFMMRLDGWSGVAERLISTENILEHLTDYAFFQSAVQVNCDLTSYLIETMVEKLDSLDVDEWQDALRNVESFIYKITHLFLDMSKLKRVPDDAVTAYRGLLIEVAKDEFYMDDSRWLVFYEKTDKRRLKPTAKNIRDIFIARGSITPDKFLFFSDLLLKHGALEQESADVARKILTPVGGDDDCLAFIVDNDQKFIPILKKAEDDAADFKDIVRRKLMTPTADEKLRRFAKAIGVKVEIEE